MPEEVLIEAASDGAATQTGGALVAATDHTFAAENHERDRLIVTADTFDIWLSFGTGAAVQGQGIRVKAGGDPYVESGWKGEVHGISSGAALYGINETSYHAGDDEGERQPGADTFAPTGPSDNYYQRAVKTAPPPGTPYPPQ